MQFAVELINQLVQAFLAAHDTRAQVTMLALKLHLRNMSNTTDCFTLEESGKFDARRSICVKIRRVWIVDETQSKSKSMLLI